MDEKKILQGANLTQEEIGKLVKKLLEEKKKGNLKAQEGHKGGGKK